VLVATARKVLLVEDNSDDADFLRMSLRKYTDSVDITHTSLIGDAVTVLEDERFDVVLLDLNLPDGRGAECVEKIHEADELVPIVVLSGHDDEDFAVDILNQGVQDYLVKWEGDGRIILRAIRYAVERKRAENKVNYLARLDWLTCIPNEQYLKDELHHATTRASRGRRTLALLLLDLDRFEAVHETLGRNAVDELLCAVVQRLTETVREGDLLARLRGERFAVLLEDVEGPLEIEVIARNVGAAFQRPFSIGGRQVSVTASVGIAIYPRECNDAEAMLANAESAVREAKEQGPNTFKFLSASIQEEVLAHRRLEHDLKTAIVQAQFELLYQPQVRLADDRIEAVEALLRWNHPERGRISPEEFIGVAEKSGYIIPLGLWVIEEVCRQLELWKSSGVPLPRVAINIAGAQLRRPGFPDEVRNLLQSHSVDPGLIEFELTERSLMDDPVGMEESLYALRDVGVRIAIDCFGAGTSCFSYLQRIPLDVLKIDRSCVSDVDTNFETQVMCSIILTIAHRLSLDAVAEGVESEKQEAFLIRHDCLYGQGDHFSAPIEPDRVAAMMVERGIQTERKQRRVIRRRKAITAA
jgi:diguanylate cyclase (GGDEF)-like protein